jgi:hypothetical protein
MKRRKQPSPRPTTNQKKEMTITRVNNRLEKIKYINITIK